MWSRKSEKASRSSPWIFFELKRSIKQLTLLKNEPREIRIGQGAGAIESNAMQCNAMEHRSWLIARYKCIVCIVCIV